MTVESDLETADEEAIAAITAVLGFPVSAVASGCSCLTCARRMLEELAKKGWKLAKVETNV